MMKTEHVCNEKAVLQRALDVADATEWRASSYWESTANFMTAIRSARVLAKEIRRLQTLKGDAE